MTLCNCKTLAWSTFHICCLFGDLAGPWWQAGRSTIPCGVEPAGDGGGREPVRGGVALRPLGSGRGEMKSVESKPIPYQLTLAPPGVLPSKMLNSMP